MRIVRRLAALVAGLGALPGALAAAEPARRAVILYTASLEGELEDCGCRDAKGGAARRHAYVARTRAAAEAPVFLVDVGDSLRRVQPGEALQREDAARRDGFLVSLQARLGVDARALGPLDLALGRMRLDELRLLETALACNLEAAAGAPIPASRLVERGGVRLGFVGASPDDLPEGEAPGFRSRPAGPAIRHAAEVLRARGAEVVVLLSALGLTRDFRVVTADLGVDLVLGGRSRDTLRRPLVRDGVPLMQAGARGQAIGRVDLTWGDRPLEVRHQVVDLTADMPEDPAVRQAVRRYLRSSVDASPPIAGAEGAP